MRADPTDRGYAGISVKDIQTTHPENPAEVHDRGWSPTTAVKRLSIGQKRADELAKRGKVGASFACGAKRIGLDVKYTEANYAGSGSIQDVGAPNYSPRVPFTLHVGQTAILFPAGAKTGPYIASLSTIQWAE